MMIRIPREEKKSKIEHTGLAFHLFMISLSNITYSKIEECEWWTHFFNPCMIYYTTTQLLKNIERAL